MILPKALALGAQLMVPVARAAADSVPELNVEQVCQGIAQQGGVTFHDPAIARKRKTASTVSRRSARSWSSNGRTLIRPTRSPV